MLSGMERRFRCDTCATKWFTVRDEPPGECRRCGGTLLLLSEDVGPARLPYGQGSSEDHA
ncbi:hypothetical protein DSM104329_04994 [Capillimicrobium parvum]|uniref:Uncharacterized protein n=1 Tax=Capillimicrobium parvum TaxID=2884022 RepID=A0A9E7C3C8_9ACTN|nr:hypothetical protein DSM104329_04994 [Capillimicrobium parvum]